MAKFSVERDEDENEEGPSNNRPLPKKPRTSFDPTLKRPTYYTSKNSAKYAASKAVDAASTSATPSVPLVREPRLDKRSIIEEDDGFDFFGIGSMFGHFEEEDDFATEESEDEDDEEEEIAGTETVANSSPHRNSTGTESAERRSDAPPPFSFSLADPDVLDCTICFVPLRPPVYQCENGHIACASCCSNMKNKCAVCSMPIGYNRCRAIENVIESIRISCPNMRYGCKKLLTYNKKLDHEKTCNYSPCSCPYPGCAYIGRSISLYSHFYTQHTDSSMRFHFDFAFSVMFSNNQKYTFLQARDGRTLFVLNRCIEPRGSFINVVCIASALSKTKFLYEISAKDGVSSMNLKTVAEVTPQWNGLPPDKKYLFVPKDFVSDGELKLELTIRKLPETRRV
ncbi:hypothetical protein CASFOL_015372 [Castilleja foliolosa]|uniref:RING-type E3 ubiquitin transferase n=1 Tax=Castilleja foliolosa TaxID=1961234 RepID=A0ABD3DH71_9LAMI